MCRSSILDTVRAALRGRTAQWLAAAAGTCLLALCLFSPAQQVIDPDLDPSNYGTYVWFTAHERQYGTDIVPMVGPFGFVPYGLFYAGHLFGERLILEALTKLALAALLVWFFRRSESGWVRWAWLASIAIMAPALPDVPYDLASLFAGLCLLANGTRPRRWLDIALVALLALLTLFKGTQTQMALLSLGLTLGQTLVRRDLRRAAWLLSGYILALVALLLAAGQNPLHFPAYVRGTLELSSGYNNAMGIDETLPEFVVGVMGFGALLLMASLGLFLAGRDMSKAPGIVLFAAFTFVQWKHGYVRADDHVFFFFDYACIAAPTLWLWAFRHSPGTPSGRAFVLGAALGWLAALGGHWADGLPSLPRHRWLLQQLPGTLATTWRQIAAPAHAKAELSAQLDRNRRWYELPLTKTRVGESSVDFFGFHQGYILLNRLNYQPRPMGGGAFNVYSPWLLDRNLAAMSDPARRPECFLVQAETIDDRLLAQDDSTTLRALLALYRPVDFENGIVLFGRSERSSIPEPRPLAQQAFAPGQTIAPPAVGPDELLAIEVDLPLNLLGRARSLLYRPPMAFIDLEGEGIVNPQRRRLVPAMFARPVLLSPAIEDTADLVSLYTAEKGKRVKSFRIHTESPSLFATREMRIRFYAVPRPAQAAAAAPILRRFAFKATDWLPSAKDAPGSHLRRVGGMDVRVLDAPASIRYRLPDGASTIRLIYGVDPEAYIKGHTDGVEFLVDLARPGQPAQPLFSRLLKPATRPEDRPFQIAEIVLPPHPAGSHLLLRTGIGPDNDGAWDWGFFAGVGCGTGDYIPAQFPGFARLPSEVEADTCGAFVHEGRPVFLLNPPGRMTFTLGGTETALDFDAGLLPGAYSSGGNSDGVDLLVELQEPKGTIRTILSQHINPRDRKEDRGSTRIHVPIPAATPGTRLHLKIGPGPAGNGSWDWSYIANLRIE